MSLIFINYSSWKNASNKYKIYRKYIPNSIVCKKYQNSTNYKFNQYKIKVKVN